MRKVSEGYKKRLIDGAMEIRENDAWETNSVVYLPKPLVIMPLPTQHTNKTSYERIDGDLTTRVSNLLGEPLVSGPLPRLILYKLVTRAKLDKNRRVYLDSKNKLLGALNKQSNGRHTIGLGEATRGLMNCAISQRRRDGEFESISHWNISESQNYWWEEKDGEDALGPQSYIEFSESFYKEIENSIPIDFRALDLLRMSAMAMDLYCWLTWRLFRLEEKNEPYVRISIKQLFYQFSHGYANNPRGLNNFQSALKKLLEERVLVIYAEAKVKFIKGALLLMKSPPHVRKKRCV